MDWIRSTRCSSGACLDARRAGTDVDVRDSRGVILTVPHEAWRHFIGTIQASEQVSEPAQIA